MVMTLEQFNHLWPKLGGFFAIGITIICFWYVGFNPEYEMFVFLFWLHLAFLMYHQFEEYIYPGGFKEFFNTKTVFALDNPQENAPVTEEIITFVKMLAWVVFLIGAVLATSALWIGVAMIIFNIVNIIGHLGIFQIKHKGYNPGFLTSLLLLLPLILFVFIYIVNTGSLTFEESVLALVFGLLTAAALPILGLRQKRKFQALSKS